MKRSACYYTAFYLRCNPLCFAYVSNTGPGGTAVHHDEWKCRDHHRYPEWVHAPRFVTDGDGNWRVHLLETAVLAEVARLTPVPCRAERDNLLPCGFRRYGGVLLRQIQRCCALNPFSSIQVLYCASTSRLSTSKWIAMPRTWFPYSCDSAFQRSYSPR